MPTTRPKVVLVANTSWYLGNFRSNLIRALTDRYEVFTAAPRDSHAGALEALGSRHLPIPFSGRAVDPVRDARTLALLFHTYSTHRPDFILNFTSKATVYSSLAAAGSQARVVNNISGLGRAFEHGGSPLLRSVALGLNRLAGAVAWHTFYQNPSDMAFGLARSFSPEDRSSLLPGSGVDLTRFRPAIRPLGRPFHFLHVGRLMREKGTFDFLRVAEAMAARVEAGEVRFTLAGFEWDLSAEDRRELHEVLARAPVRFLGMVDDVERLYADAHCVVLPSRYPEGVPRVLLEAAASGKVLVCYPNPGSERVVRDGETGFVAAERNWRELATAMEQVLELSEPEYRRIALGSAEIARRRFDEREVIGAYLDLLGRCHRGGGARGEVGPILA